MKSRTFQGCVYLALSAFAIASYWQSRQSDDPISQPVRHLSEMSLTDWSYKRTLTDANSTTVTDHAVQILLDGSNFTFAHANSDGSDLRFWDATEGTELPYWIKSYDSASETAEIWVRVADISHAIEMYYGNATAGDNSDGEACFAKLFNDFSQGDVGQIPAGYRYGSGVPDSTHFCQIAASPTTVRGNRLDWVVAMANIATSSASNGVDNAYASRVPHQRSGFKAAGRYWLFYAQYTGAHPYSFFYTSSLDGATWASGVNIGTIPLADADFDVFYDADAEKVHVIRNTLHTSDQREGLEYRRGTPGGDGTISWDADWQLVIHPPNKVGDPSLCVDSNGNAWVGYDADPEARAIKNANTDGTWSTAANFPVTLTSGTNADHESGAIMCRLDSGAMYAVLHQWGIDRRIDGALFAAGDHNFTIESNITAKDVQATSADATEVARVDASGRGGKVHITYCSTDDEIRHVERTADGALTETVVAAYHADGDYSSPRICFDGVDDLVVLWTDSETSSQQAPDRRVFDTIYLVQRVGGNWQVPRKVAKPNSQRKYEHLMPWREAVSGELGATTHTGNFVLKHLLIDLSPARSTVAQSLHCRKSTTTNTGFHQVNSRAGGVAAGDLLELDFYVAGMGATSRAELARLNNINATNIGAYVALYGANAGLGGNHSLGYHDGSDNRIAPINVSTWYRLGVRFKVDNVYDLILNGTTIATNIGPSAGSADYSYLFHGAGGTNASNFYVDNIRLRPWVEIEPEIVVGAEQSTDEPAFHPALLRRTRLIGAGTL